MRGRWTRPRGPSEGSWPVRPDHLIEDKLGPAKYSLVRKGSPSRGDFLSGRNRPARLCLVGWNPSSKGKPAKSRITAVMPKATAYPPLYPSMH